MTSASVSTVVKPNQPKQRIRRLRLTLPNGGVNTRFVQDTGFFNIGVRPQNEDLGVGGTDDTDNKNPLSELQLAKQGNYKQLLGDDPPTLDPPLGQPPLDLVEPVGDGRDGVHGDVAGDGDVGLGLLLDDAKGRRVPAGLGHGAETRRTFRTRRPTRGGRPAARG